MLYETKRINEDLERILSSCDSRMQQKLYIYKKTTRSDWIRTKQTNIQRKYKKNYSNSQTNEEVYTKYP